MNVQFDALWSTDFALTWKLWAFFCFLFYQILDIFYLRNTEGTHQAWCWFAHQWLIVGFKIIPVPMFLIGPVNATLLFCCFAFWRLCFAFVAFRPVFPTSFIYKGPVSLYHNLKTTPSIKELDSYISDSGQHGGLGRAREVAFHFCLSPATQSCYSYAFLNSAKLCLN